MYQLAIHPENQQKLHEELDRVYPDPTKPLTKQQLEEMRYELILLLVSILNQSAILSTVRGTVWKVAVMRTKASHQDKEIVLGRATTRAESVVFAVMKVLWLLVQLFSSRRKSAFCLTIVRDIVREPNVA